MKYRKKPVVVEATRWYKSGDHPEDNREEFTGSDGEPFLGEGKVVRYYRDPTLDGQYSCGRCGRIMHDRGWIDTLEDGYIPCPGHIVCPGDWIITDVQGERYPCKPNIFEATYEKVESSW
jgi:hypothetical protein